MTNNELRFKEIQDNHHRDNYCPDGDHHIYASGIRRRHTIHLTCYRCNHRRTWHMLWGNKATPDLWYIGHGMWGVG